jgi:O-antigen biosynthesis protein
LGQRVTVFPINASPAEPAAVYADVPDTVEVMHDRVLAQLPAFLAERAGYYDTIWIGRTHNLDRLAPLLRSFRAQAAPPRVVLDTEAITALRQAARAALPGSPEFDTASAIRQEFASADLCQTIVAVSQGEADVLRAAGFANVTVIGHCRDVELSPRGFDERAGMLFLGAMHEPDSPNFDALEWFVSDVLPLIEHSLGWETRLTVAGYLAPSVSLEAFRDHPRITLRGPVEDVAPLYASHRLVVSPTRYAAGLPYKIHEAASYGVPVVTTELLRRQLGWEDEVIAEDPADPEAFARAVVTLYRDPGLWRKLREGAAARVRAENDRAQYRAAIAQVLAC